MPQKDFDGGNWSLNAAKMTLRPTANDAATLATSKSFYRQWGSEVVKYSLYKAMPPNFAMETARTMGGRNPFVIATLVENILENNVDKV
jgi:hypothetical protein